MKIHRHMTPEERFWCRVQKTDGCWLWTGKPTSDGYGCLKINDQAIRAHSYSYMLHKGEIPEGLFVCHDCPGGDNPLCVNPDHLFLGTAQDNMTDRDAKGRTATGDRNGSRLHPEKVFKGEDHPWRKGNEYHHQGEKNGRAKLNEDDVRLIREMWNTGQYTKSGLGRNFGVSDVLVHKIIHGQLWTHVEQR